MIVTHDGIAHSVKMSRQPWVYSYVLALIMLRLMVAYTDLIEILHHNLNKRGYKEYVLVGVIWTRKRYTM